MLDRDDLLKNKEEMIKKGVNKAKKIGILGVVGFVGAVALSSALFNVEAGEQAVEQTPSGKLIAHMTPGYKIKWPFVGNVWFYDEVTTVTYNEVQGDYGTSKNAPYGITFGDTYGGEVKGSFRIKLPKDPDKFVSLHREFKSYENFVESGAEKFTNELLTYTAQQFTGESFMQGGQNEYKNRLEDQARNGLYVTKRTAVKVKKQAGTVGLKQDKASKTVDSEAVVYKNVVQRDSKGTPLRQENSMEEYGVTVSQVTIDGFNPQQDLRDFMKNKKEQVRKRAKLVEEQENERQQAITAKLKGDRERVQAKQKMLMAKDQAEIELAKQVQVAKLQADKEKVERQKLADLAVIDKKKELQMAKDDENIQKAKERAAKYEAQAKLHNGLADAKILKAKYDAYDKKLYAMEIQRDTMKAVTENLQGITVKMPNVNIQGGTEGKTMNSVDTVLNAIGVQKLEEIASSNSK